MGLNFYEIIRYANTKLWKNCGLKKKDLKLMTFLCLWHSSHLYLKEEIHFCVGVGEKISFVLENSSNISYPSFSYSQEVVLLILAVRSSPVDLFTAQQNHRCSYHTKTISQSNQAYFPKGLIWWKQHENNWNAIFYTDISKGHFTFQPKFQMIDSSQRIKIVAKIVVV